MGEKGWIDDMVYIPSSSSSSRRECTSVEVGLPAARRGAEQDGHAAVESGLGRGGSPGQFVEAEAEGLDLHGGDRGGGEEELDAEAPDLLCQQLLRRPVCCICCVK